METITAETLVAEARRHELEAYRLYAKAEDSSATWRDRYGGRAAAHETICNLIRTHLMSLGLHPTNV